MAHLVPLRLDESRYSDIVKSLDVALKTESQGEASRDRLQQLHFNRGWCYQKLDLNRKALKDFNEAIKLGSLHPKIHLHKGQVLCILNKKEEAKHVWKERLAKATIDDDLDVIQTIISALKNPETPTVVTRVERPKETKKEVETVKVEVEGSASKASESDVTVSQRVKDMIAGMEPEAAVGIAVEKINQGQLADAEEMLEELSKKIPDNPGVRVARGTARALLRKLEGAIDDFSVAIRLYPMYAESWKRRGQARGALGQNEEALADLEKALQLSSDHHSKAECLTEQGMLYHKLKDYKRAVEVLEKSLGLNAKSTQASNMLGLCRISLGDIAEGLDAYDKTMRLDHLFKEAYFNKCQALKEVGRVKDAEKVYWEGRRVEREVGGEKHLGINRVMASMYQCMGQHHKAIPFLDEVLESHRPRQKLECYFLRAACNQAMGKHQDAVRIT